jgi:RNA polymerase sigma-70 factor, ECF subfamily
MDMFAVVEETGRFQVGVAETPRYPAFEIDSTAFLEALQDGTPAAERAFRHLVRHLRAPLTRFIGRWFPETEAIEDVLQETFLAIHESLPTFAGDLSLTTWAYSLACEKAMSRLPEEYVSGNSIEAVFAHYREFETRDPRPDEAAHRSKLIALIRSAAETLPEHYRVVWRLCDLEEMSGEEAAEALGITPTLVRVRVHRARGMIAARLRNDRPEIFRGSVDTVPRLPRRQARSRLAKRAGDGRSHPCSLEGFPCPLYLSVIT